MIKYLNKQKWERYREITGSLARGDGMMTVKMKGLASTEVIGIVRVFVRRGVEGKG